MFSISVQIVILLWLVALGGAIGSFLNVVVYRLPLGMSLVEPRSHCPQCKHPIRWYDNVPILGWLLLGGRCRDCKAAISSRYPIVEAIAAALFLWLGMAEILTWGANLPIRPVMVPDGFIDSSLGVGELTGILAYHLLLLATLLAASLMEYDGHRVPWRVTLPALLVAGAAPLVWPHLHPVPVSPWLEGWMAGLADGAAGLAAGVAWGLVVEYEVLERRDLGSVAVWGCVGLVLGWQATVVVGILSTAVHPLVLVVGLMTPGSKKPGWLAGLTVTILLWMLLWAPVTDQWPSLK